MKKIVSKMIKQSWQKFQFSWKAHGWNSNNLGKEDKAMIIITNDQIRSVSM